MTLKTRRILYLSFTTIFFIIAPILILYTSGWRWNFYKNKLEKIGGLVIATVPARVNIRIGDSEILRQTPWRSPGLLPNKYDITISKPGYYDWQKQLAIRSGETTFAEDIYLFKKNSPLIPWLKQAIKWWTYNKQNDFVLWQTDNELKLYNSNIDQTKTLSKLSGEIINEVWSNNQQNLLIQTSDNYYFWRLTEPTKLIDLNKAFGPNLKNCRFVISSDDSVLCLNNQGLWQYNILALASNQLLSADNGQLIDFYQADGDIYYLEKNNSDQNVYLKVKMGANRNSYPDYLLPASNAYKFIRVKNNLATILDKNNQKLYLLNLFDEQAAFNKTSRIISDVKWVFYPNDDTIVYYNDWEIWVAKKSKTSLITRQSDKINQVLMHPSQNHLVIVSQQGIKIIELDDRDRRNTAEVVKLPNIKKASLNNEADQVIFSFNAKDSKLTGLYAVQILSLDEDETVPTEKP